MIYPAGTRVVGLVHVTGSNSRTDIYGRRGVVAVAPRADWDAYVIEWDGTWPKDHVMRGFLGFIPTTPINIHEEL